MSTREAPEGYCYVPGQRLLECLLCGAAVVNIHTHDGWHGHGGNGPSVSERRYEPYPDSPTSTYYDR